MNVRKFDMRFTRSLLSVLICCLTVVFIVINSRPGTESIGTQTSLTMERRNLEKEEEIFASEHRTNNGQTYRYVTPSLAELGGRGILPEMNSHVLMLTRVPDAGAELLVLLLQRLQGYNAFKHIRLPPGDDGLLTTLQQELLVEEITSIIRQEAIPLSFDGDVRFLNFSEFGRQSPTFVSLVRDPLDQPALQRYQKAGMMSSLYRGAIAHFCGQDPRCAERNNNWAFQQAKSNVIRWYPVVGILENMEDSLSALEAAFPYFFNGATRVYEKFRSKQNHSSSQGGRLKPRMKKVLKKIFANEVEFYLWLKSRLFNETSENG